METCSQRFRLDDAVHELLKHLSSLHQIIHVQAPLSLISHWRNILRREVFDEDVPQPHEVVVSSFDFVAERMRAYFIHGIFLGEYSFVDDFRIEYFYLQPRLAIQLVRLQKLRGLRCERVVLSLIDLLTFIAA